MALIVFDLASNYYSNLAMSSA